MRGKFYYLGNNVKLYTRHFGTEPYLISIHDNVTCAADVKFINHDVSVFNVACYLGISNEQVDKVGSIELFDNCFVGAYTILMPNTSVGKNSIIAAGSVVTKHIPSDEVWGGCPAHYIMKTADYAKKVVESSKAFPWIEKKSSMAEEQLIKMRQEYFFNAKFKKR